jgi:hypothetical protein
MALEKVNRMSRGTVMRQEKDTAHMKMRNA